MTLDISGFAPVRFAAVKDRFAASVAAGEELGARFTLVQAALSAVLSVALAIPLARALARARFAGRGLVTALPTLFIRRPIRRRGCRSPSSEPRIISRIRSSI